MIIGHLPAGYLIARGLDRSFDRDPVIWWGILIGSVAPDLDMFWFYVVDGGTVHHHTYLTHDPTLWAGVLLAGFVLSSRALIGCGIGTLLHMSLDTIAGAISWGFGDWSFSGPLIVVPATQDHWILSFVLHWTFLGDVLLVVLALVTLVRARRKISDAEH